MTERDYHLLSAVTPAVAQSGDYPDFFMPWREPNPSGQARARPGRAGRAAGGRG